MRFSERTKYRAVRQVIQFESIDEPLKNSLWSLLTMHVWEKAHRTAGMYPGFYFSANPGLYKLSHSLWFSYFKKPLDTLGSDWEPVRENLRQYFFSCEWFEVYDFIEFVANNYDDHQFRGSFATACNKVLERELSAYRFVDGLIARVTDAHEITEIEESLERAAGPVSAHTRRALELLSNREQPDYRNSIKESISAVESLVRQAVGSQNGTLGHLIKHLEDEFGFHQALTAAFSKLYGYTSDADGIRHALMGSDRIGFDEAKFMLVACSAFINLVNSKIRIAG